MLRFWRRDITGTRYSGGESVVSNDTEAVIQKELTTVQQFLEVFEKANKEKPKPEDMKALRRMLNEGGQQVNVAN